MSHSVGSSRRTVYPGLRWMAAVLLVGGMLGVTGCSTNDLTSVLPSEDISDPAALETSKGALLTYKGALAGFSSAFSGVGVTPYTLASGQLSDELTSAVSSFPMPANLLDLRDLPETEGAPAGVTYTGLHNFRIVAQQGTGALQRYGQAYPASYIGQLLGYEGFAENMLAEMFCSGISLGQAPYGGDIIHGPALRTEKVYEHALALLDSALLYSADSARILNMVRVGRGRTLLNLGRFAEAATAVQDVPTTFVHQILYITSTGAAATNNVFRNSTTGRSRPDPLFSVADRQGTNGLDYVSAGDASRGANRDPRVMTAVRATDAFYFRIPYRFPLKYSPTGGSPMTLADGVEARLIEAEAALRANDIATWTAKLNELRAAAPTLPGFTPALTAMPALTADSTTTASATMRVDVMFRERAFWLFLTGHRLGDMRRLIRQYGRAQNQVFPVGTWASDVSLHYGIDVTAPIPLGESLNPHYQGCIDRNA